VDDLVETRPEDALVTLTRGQETELPASAKIRFIASEGDYQQAGRRRAASSAPVGA
jgi:hypothetical protein